MIFPVSSPPPATINNANGEQIGNKENYVTHHESTRDVIISFLERCAIPYPTPVAFDPEFDAVCRSDAIRRGCAPSGPHSLSQFIPSGVVMATTAYAHLPSEATMVLIALYTACGLYIDDVFQHDVDAVRFFNERFVQHSPQANTVLDCFAKILLDFPEHFDPVVSNVMVTSTLNAVTALILEYDTQGTTLGPSMLGYPTLSRVISGASETYALFAFPKELKLATFIQTLQQLQIFINNGNDILSFHKDNIESNSVNRISLLAAQFGTTKEVALWNLAHAAIAAHARVQDALAMHASAFAAYRAFSHGYICFHVSTKRYRLSDLHL